VSDHCHYADQQKLDDMRVVHYDDVVLLLERS
jgi:hypothetical protein